MVGGNFAIGDFQVFLKRLYVLLFLLRCELAESLDR